MDKKDLLKAVEEIKTEIEKGKVTNLIIATSNNKGDISTQICSTVVDALGLADILKMEIKQKIETQKQGQHFKDLLGMFAGDDKND